MNDNPFKQWIDLAQPRLGSEVVYTTDDFFAAKERMIEPNAPEFIADKFDDNGKWMDGWESRRRRSAGHDYCIIKFGVCGIIYGVDIDTSFFTGNFPPSASIDACNSENVIPEKEVIWHNIVPVAKLSGDSHHYLPVGNNNSFTHLRINIFPDGGIARLRVYGEIKLDLSIIETNDVIDLVALENGGRAIACNDEHYGSMHNLNAPGRGVNMADGWETARRREPGNDWAILALAYAGEIEKIEIDTAHFKGNFPDRASIQGANITDADSEGITSQSLFWDTLLPEMNLQMDKQHYFTEEIKPIGTITHVRLNIFPDGGISRLRLLGKPNKDSQ